jgi:hypothetical protein
MHYTITIEDMEHHELLKNKAIELGLAMFSESQNNIVFYGVVPETDHDQIAQKYTAVLGAIVPDSCITTEERL